METELGANLLLLPFNHLAKNGNQSADVSCQWMCCLIWRLKWAAHVREMTRDQSQPSHLHRLSLFLMNCSPWWIFDIRVRCLQSAAPGQFIQINRPWNLGRGHSSCCIAIPLRRMTTPSLIFSPLHSKGLDCNSVATLDLISWADYFIDSISPFLSKMKDRPISQTMGVIYH